ncbi:MAG: hypothetical protein NZ853_10315 [Leptospiraceae bacterium]|nr:hypothetical protein [Leptospiraceae bacterium]MDW7974949.1 hypothetical protein [Leptospiraceae bacterium]
MLLIRNEYETFYIHELKRQNFYSNYPISIEMDLQRKWENLLRLKEKLLDTIQETEEELKQSKKQQKFMKEQKNHYKKNHFTLDSSVNNLNGNE